MSIGKRMSEQEYREFALTGEGKLYELWDGIAREKPLTNVRHGYVSSYLGFALADRLDRSVYRVSINGHRARRSERDYFIPDVLVAPASIVVPFLGDPDALAAFSEPLPLVVEVWSWTEEPYDFAARPQAYRERGDEEIWYIHPFEHTLNAWHLQPDGNYTETLYAGGIVPVASLPDVTIDLDDLLDM